MSPSIRRNGQGGFTLAETLITLFIAVFIFGATMAVYIMGWRWWAEIAPRAEAQRIVRVALSSIIEGTVDPTAGTYTMGGTAYGRRSGIAWATAAPDIPSSSRIDFQLNKPGETSNVRSFYLAAVPNTQQSAVYYRDSSSVDHLLKATRGITGLLFEPYLGYSTMVKVTATVEKDIPGTRRQPYHLKIEISEVVFLRNVP